MKYACNYVPPRGWGSCDSDATWEITWNVGGERGSSLVCVGHLANKLHDLSALAGVNVFTVRRLRAMV